MKNRPFVCSTHMPCLCLQLVSLCMHCLFDHMYLFLWWSMSVKPQLRSSALQVAYAEINDQDCCGRLKMHIKREII